METYELIQRKTGIHIFSVIIVLMFYTYQPSAYSEEAGELEGVEYVKPAKHVFRLQPKESFEVRNGRIIYLEHCSPCHGTTGKGNGSYYASGLEPKPRDFTNPEFMNRVDDEYLFEVIGKGTAVFGKSPYCPPWRLTLKEDEKIKNIIVFLRTLCKQIDKDINVSKNE